MRNTVRDFSLIKGDEYSCVIGDFVRYGPNRVLVNTATGIKGNQSSFKPFKKLQSGNMLIQ